MDSINFKLVPGRHQVSIEIDIEDVVDHINKLELHERWELVAKLLFQINFKDPENLSAGQKYAIHHFLERWYRYYKFGIKPK